MLDELSMNSPRNMKSPSKASIINEVSSKHIHIRADSEINPLCPVPELHIKVVNSGPIAKDTRFCITKQGLSGSKRQCKDGKVYFGCKRKEKGIRANDVVIPIHDKELEEHHRGRHFMISYQSHKYFIKDLGKGFGVYARVDSPLVLFT